MNYIKVEFNNEHPFVQFLDFAKQNKKLYGRQNLLGAVEARLSMINIFYHEFINAIPEFQKEQMELRERGYVDGLHRFVLVVRYEAFLNSVYSLMEIVALVKHRLFGNKSMPKTFRRQKEWYEKMRVKGAQIDDTYANIVAQTTWYDEVHKIRSEATHYLTGLIVSYRDDIPGYLNFPIGERDSSPTDIEVHNIEQHGKDIIAGINKYFQEVGLLFLDYIDKDERVLHICGFTSDKLICAVMYSYNEFIMKQPGVCMSLGVNCPKSKGCKARINATNL